MNIAIIVENSYIVARVRERWSRAEGEYVRAETARIVREKELSGVLIDVRDAEIDVGTLDIYEVTRSLKDAYPPHVRHAMVVDVPLTDEDMKFYETVAF
jgi:hypothetical protein